MLDKLCLNYKRYPVRKLGESFICSKGKESFLCILSIMMIFTPRIVIPKNFMRSNAERIDRIKKAKDTCPDLNQLT